MPMFALGFKCPAPPRGPETLRAELLGDLAAELLAGESSPLYVRLYEQGLIDSGFSAGYEGLKGACLVSASGDSKDPAACATPSWTRRTAIRDGWMRRSSPG